MAVNVYADKSKTELIQRGFRWCTKDCRWESRRDIDQEACMDLAEEFEAPVELVRSGEVVFRHPVKEEAK